jgi:hypothetical protein
MSQLIAFYRGQSPNSEGWRIHDVWSRTDDDLELLDDAIQWLFPLQEPCEYKPHAPLLTEKDISTFRADETIQANLRKSFERILSLLGLTMTGSGEVVEGPNFSIRRPDVWDTPSRKCWQLGRILRSLSLLGLEREAQAIYRTLELPREFSPTPQRVWRGDGG